MTGVHCLNGRQNSEQMGVDFLIQNSKFLDKALVIFLHFVIFRREHCLSATAAK